MFIHLQNHWSSEFFREKRLVFRGEKGTDVPGKKPTPAELAAQLRGMLTDLQADVGPPPGSTAKSNPGHLRELTPPPPVQHKETVIAVDRALKLNGKMDVPEIKLMQATHELIYEHYINPAFILYLKPGGLDKEVFPILDLLLHDPGLFKYSTKENGRVEITKRQPFDDKKKAIPDNFLIVIEQGAITQVRAAAFDRTEMKDGAPIHVLTNPVDRSLIGKGGDIPWMSNPEYNKRMQDYRDRFNEEFVLLDRTDEEKEKEEFNKLSADMTDAQADALWEELLVEPYANLPKEMQELYALDNIDFPRRFVALVQARNLGFELTDPNLGFELTDPRFKEVLAAQNLQGETYTEITRDPKNKLKIRVTKEPKQEGVYRIHLRSKKWKNPLRISKEGFMMVRRPDGVFVPDPRYHRAVTFDYYRKNPEATGVLTDEEKRDLEKEMGNITIATLAQEALQKDAENKAKWKKIESMLQPMSFDQLKAFAIRIAPEFTNDINTLPNTTDKKDLIETIKKFFDQHPDRMEAAALDLALGSELDRVQDVAKLRTIVIDLGIEAEEKLSPKTKADDYKKIIKVWMGSDATKIKQISDKLKQLQ